MPRMFMPGMFATRVQMGFNVSTSVVWFLLFKRTFGPLFHSLNFFLQVQGQSSSSLNLVGPILTHFFMFKNLQAWFKNQVQFYVHFTNSPMLDLYRYIKLYEKLKPWGVYTSTNFNT